MKRRLVVAIACTAAGAVLLFALPLAVVLERSYRDEELLRLQRDTVAASRGIDLSRGAPDHLELPRFSGKFGIYALNGSRIAGIGPPLADQATRGALRHHVPSGSAPDGQLVVAVPLLNGEVVSGAVRAQRSAASVSSRAHHAWLGLAGLGLGVVGLAVLAALALARRLASPLERLAATARRVGEGDFAALAPPTKIEEIGEVGEALNRSSRRIGELVGRERAFSSDASHQLRTPLAALRLNLETAALIPSAQQPELAAAVAQVDRLQGTIETLLAVARGTPRGDQRTDLSQAVRDLERRWHGPLAAEGRPLRTVVEVEHAVAAVSPAVLSEITEVLLQNAHDHGAGAVTVVVRPVGEAFALEVSDHGPGFGPDPEEAFRRGTGNGHGIGMALARSLAHAEGARLRITCSGPGPTVSLIIASA
ncbi:MAG: HAMP domain-containing histidine kinase [Actinomycetota bacterium]|nr:HAMP domain-containing histidine kinase [Actinomycetota bacterium]